MSGLLKLQGQQILYIQVYYGEAWRYPAHFYSFQIIIALIESWRISRQRTDTGPCKMILTKRGAGGAIEAGLVG